MLFSPPACSRPACARPCTASRAAERCRARRDRGRVVDTYLIMPVILVNNQNAAVTNAVGSRNVASTAISNVTVNNAINWRRRIGSASCPQ